MIPTMCRTAVYRLTSGDAEKINRRRTTGQSIAERIKASVWPIGAQAHIGNPVSEGDQFPMIVVRVSLDGLSIGGQVFLDGNDTYWVQAEVGNIPGTWHWPTPAPESPAEKLKFPRPSCF